MKKEKTSPEETPFQNAYQYIRHCVVNSNKNLSEEILKKYLSECTKSELDKLIAECCFTLDVLKFIIAEGGDPRASNDILLLYAVGYNDYARLIPYLLELGLDPNKNDTFAEACRTLDPEYIKMFLDYGAKITDSVIINTMRYYKVDVMKVLMEHGAKVEDFLKCHFIRTSGGDKRKAEFLRFLATDEIDYVSLLKECADAIENCNLSVSESYTNIIEFETDDTDYTVEDD